MSAAFRTKPLSTLLAQLEEHGGLKRTLGWPGLIALGIGAVIGAGLFARTPAAAGQNAGPAVILSFVVAAIGCAFAGLCYAEFAAMIPIAGSAYTYAYVTMGELVAWVIGWALILEYGLGAATLSIYWSEYFNNLFPDLVPWAWRHSPLQVGPGGIHGILNAPAVLVLLAITLLLIKGISESAGVNAVIVAVKVAIVLLIIAIGWHFINPANHHPFVLAEDAAHTGLFKHGWGGVLGGAGVVFFAFIGFDAVSTAAQETIDPGRNMPIGILGSLTVCTVLYVLFSWVLTGIAPSLDFIDPNKGMEASVSWAIKTYMPGYAWLSTLVSVAILAGFSSVILVMLLGQSRVFYSMSKDGLLPRVFAELHPRFRTPYKCNLVLYIFVALIGALLPGDITGNMTNLGTLFAFVLVCIGVMVMRRKNPGQPRPFRVPFVPVVPILGALFCLAMIISVDSTSKIAAGSWMVIGLCVYFLYAGRHSNLGEAKMSRNAEPLTGD
ncbi:MAG TPA: amino acid permease [Bryobacteraceae bacterium]|jgi:APA family basic amino acid/polyamine antiporter|nr:amino acid permease [Bryobacteraceae bacterium]